MRSKLIRDERSDTIVLCHDSPISHHIVKLSLKIASRLSLSRNNRHRRSLAVKVATTSVAISLTVMILTLAITSGFRSAIKHKISGFEAQLKITGVDRTDRYGSIFAGRHISLSDDIADIIGAIAPEATTNVSLTTEAMLKTPDNFSTVQLRSYAPGYSADFIKEMVDPEAVDAIDSLMLAEAPASIVISEITASELGLKIRDKINTLFFDGNNIRLRNPRIAAIYSSHFSAYDETVAFASKSLLDGICGTETDEGNAIELRELDFNRLQELEAVLQANLDNYCFKAIASGRDDSPGFYRVTPVTETAANYFSWLSLLDTNVVVMIILMSLIALFTLVATLFILIIERTSFIGIMKTLGSSNRLIRGIFIGLIGRIALRGLIFGNLLALAIIIVQSTTRILPLDPESYFLSYVPMNINVTTLLIVNASAIAVIVMAMILPSAIIGRISPAQTVRYE